MAEALAIVPDIAPSKWRPRPYFRPSPQRAVAKRTWSQKMAFEDAGGISCKQRQQAWEQIQLLGGARLLLIEYRSIVEESREYVRRKILEGASEERMAEIWANYDWWAQRLGETLEQVKAAQRNGRLYRFQMERLP